MKRLKCRVCRTRFYPKAEDKYIVKERAYGLASLTKADVYYDAFNCPQCGCQILANGVLPVYNPIWIENSKETGMENYEDNSGTEN